MRVNRTLKGKLDIITNLVIGSLITLRRRANVSTNAWIELYGVPHPRQMLLLDGGKITFYFIFLLLKFSFEPKYT